MYQAQVTQVKLNERVDRYEVTIEIFDEHGDIATFTSSPIFPDADYALEAGYTAVNVYKSTGQLCYLIDVPVEAVDQ